MFVTNWGIEKVAFILPIDSQMPTKVIDQCNLNVLRLQIICLQARCASMFPLCIYK